VPSVGGLRDLSRQTPSPVGLPLEMLASKESGRVRPLILPWERTWTVATDGRGDWSDHSAPHAFFEKRRPQAEDR